MIPWQSKGGCARRLQLQHKRTACLSFVTLRKLRFIPPGLIGHSSEINVTAIVFDILVIYTISNCSYPRSNFEMTLLPVNESVETKEQYLKQPELGIEKELEDKDLAVSSGLQDGNSKGMLSLRNCV